MGKIYKTNLALKGTNLAKIGLGANLSSGSLVKYNEGVRAKSTIVS